VRAARRDRAGLLPGVSLCAASYLIVDCADAVTVLPALSLGVAEIEKYRLVFFGMLTLNEYVPLAATSDGGRAQADYIASRDEYQDNDLVVCRLDGRPWHPDVFSTSWGRARGTLGLSLRFHDLRHTHASLLICSGVHPKALQERLDHSTPAFTMNVYAHLLPGVQEETVANLETMLQQVDSQQEEASE
jgi:integrase